MKWLASILAIYMLALFMTPCGDAPAETLVAQGGQQTYAGAQHQHEDEGATDLCTPFCVCSCCGVVSGMVLQWHFFQLDKPISVELTEPISYDNPSFITSYIGEIWQPPQLNG